MLNNLEKLFAEQEAAGEKFVPPTGTREEQGAEILRRCAEREERLLAQALEAERAGDYDGTWLAMATRAENNRLIERVKRDLERWAAEGNDEVRNQKSE